MQYRKMKLFRQVFRFYYDGFKSMTIGRNLWVIILVKLVLIFAIFKLFFFPDFLGSRFEKTQDKADYVTKELIDKLP